MARVPHGRLWGSGLKKGNNPIDLAPGTDGADHCQKIFRGPALETGTAAARQSMAVRSIKPHAIHIISAKRGWRGSLPKNFGRWRPDPPHRGRPGHEVLKTSVLSVPGGISDAGHRVRRHGGGTDGTPAAPTPPAPANLPVAPRVARDGRPRPGSSTPQGPARRCPSAPAGAPWLVPLGTLQGVPGYPLSRRSGLTGKE